MMEKLSWMRKVDKTMDNGELLELMDHMHAVIDSLLSEKEDNQKKIKSLEAALHSLKK
ncbi:hypothetical protein Amet_0809 [Alkaliphilus metalliredigens QYMF]|uniref:Uncharacterized protein n=2 Tax=Alkaliphilus TaxID=114627 RepID=A6TLG6_ALKMQ|nr:hypothetical protein Amet_0809 [Alkaliphilus metalliredigens QYMF]